MIFGNARFTMVWSRRPKKVPTITVSNIHQRRLEPLALASSIILFSVDRYLGRHAALEFRIRSHIEFYFYAEFLDWSCVRNRKDDAIISRYRADFIYDPFITFSRISIYCESSQLAGS